MSMMMPYPYALQYGAVSGSVSYQFLNALREAVIDEDTAAVYYTQLAARVEDPEQKRYIEGIAADERSHAQMWRTLYYQLTGQLIPPTNVSVTLPATNEEAFADSVKNEVQDSLGYRDLLLSTNNQYIRDLFYKAATDEASHAQLFQLFLEMA